MREETLAALQSGWTGAVHRVGFETNIPQLLVTLATPSLFGGDDLYILTTDEKAVTAHAEALLAIIGTEVQAGILILLVPSFGNKGAGQKLSKAFKKADALHKVDMPKRPQDMAKWLGPRLKDMPGNLRSSGQVADALVQYRGMDIDALLMAYETVSLYAGDDPIDAKMVHLVIGGQAESPIYEFTGAILKGNSRKALELLYAGRGMAPEMAIGALSNEIRKMLACLESEDDATVYRLAGMRGKPNLYYPRQTASGLGKRCLQRLLTGLLQTQRKTRLTGYDNMQVLEEFIHQAQRVIR